jgi:thymidine kinase
MHFGILTVICGPMFAGKSTRLIEMAKELEPSSCLLIKPAFDTRYHESRIVTHDGKFIDAISANCIGEPVDTVENIFLDEVQFMMAPYFEEDVLVRVREILGRGINVTVAGLDMDAQGQPFPITASLLGMADNVIKLKSKCILCGGSAHYTFKKVKNLNRVELGETDIYEPRCGKHWFVGIKELNVVL